MALIGSPILFTASGLAGSTITFLDEDWSSHALGSLVSGYKEVFNGGTVDVVATDALLGAPPVGLSKYLRCAVPAAVTGGESSKGADIRIRITSLPGAIAAGHPAPWNPIATPEGFYFAYEMLVPVSTLDASNSTSLAIGAQIKLHLLRHATGPGSGFNGSIHACGWANSSGRDFSFGSDDNNNWWPFNGHPLCQHALDDDGTWSHRPRYNGTYWLRVQEFHQYNPATGIGQFAAWMKKPGDSAYRAVYPLVSVDNAAVVGGGQSHLPSPTLTEIYDFQMGIAYAIVRIAQAYVTGIGRVVMRNAFISDF